MKVLGISHLNGIALHRLREVLANNGFSGLAQQIELYSKPSYEELTELIKRVHSDGFSGPSSVTYAKISTMMDRITNVAKEQTEAAEEED